MDEFSRRIVGDGEISADGEGVSGEDGVGAGGVPPGVSQFEVNVDVNVASKRWEVVDPQRASGNVSALDVTVSGGAYTKAVGDDQTAFENECPDALAVGFLYADAELVVADVKCPICDPEGARRQILAADIEVAEAPNRPSALGELAPAAGLFAHVAAVDCEKSAFHEISAVDRRTAADCKLPGNRNGSALLGERTVGDRNSADRDVGRLQQGGPGIHSVLPDAEIS